MMLIHLLLQHPPPLLPLIPSMVQPSTPPPVVITVPTTVPIMQSPSSSIDSGEDDDNDNNDISPAPSRHQIRYVPNVPPPVMNTPPPIVPPVRIALSCLCTYIGLVASAVLATVPLSGRTNQYFVYLTFRYVFFCLSVFMNHFHHFSFLQ